MKSAVDSIIESMDIVDYISNVTKLRKSGNTYRGSCPLHGGKNTNSLAVYPEDNTFHCFSCGKSGNIISFVAELENVSYSEAIEMLAREANIDISKDVDYQRQKTLYEKNQGIAYKCYQKQAVIEEYMLKKRGINKETMDAFYIGYDNSRGKAIVIPLHDKNGRIVAFCKRNLEELPKYVNSANNELYDKSEFLFNQYRAKSMINKTQKLYIVEGYIDCMAAYQQGLACVAYCGSELTKGQINDIKEMVRYNPNTVIMFAPDNDSVGQSKIPRVMEKFSDIAPKLDVRVVKIPDGCKDFDDCLINEIEIGKLESVPIGFATISILLNSCIDVQQEYNVASEFLKTIRNPINKADIVSWLAQRWKKDIEDVKLLTSLNTTKEEIIKEFKSVDDGFSEYMDLITEETSGIGFPSIDAAMKLRRSDVVFWAGCPGTYKTMFAVEMALHNAVRLNRNVLVFSLEMSAGAFYERIIGRLLHKNIFEVEQMAKTGQQAMILQKIKDKLKEHILVIDKSNLSIDDVEERIMLANSRLWKDGKTDLVIIDYFQYLRASTFEEQSEAAKYTKVLAKKFNIVLFVLSQLNRTGDNYLRPTVKMLKGTGDLEASGDYVCLAWKPDSDPKLTPDQFLEVKNHICVCIGKARRGALATDFEFKFIPEESTIKDLSVSEVDDAS